MQPSTSKATSSGRQLLINQFINKLFVHISNFQSDMDFAN